MSALNISLKNIEEALGKNRGKNRSTVDQIFNLNRVMGLCRESGLQQQIIWANKAGKITIKIKGID